MGRGLNSTIAAVDIRLSNPRAGYRVNEGIPTPLRRPVAAVRTESKLVIFSEVSTATTNPIPKTPGAHGGSRR